MNGFQERIALFDRVLGERGFRRIQRMGNASWQGNVDGRDCIVNLAPQGRTRYAGEIRVRMRIGYRLRVELETAGGPSPRGGAASSSSARPWPAGPSSAGSTV